MNIDKKEFRKYAAGHCHVKTEAVDNYISAIENSASPKAMTPYITEEREMRVAQMDVFSRLMMDRIIFLGQEVNDNIANIIQAQLLFLQSTDAKKDIQMYINSVLLCAGAANKRAALTHSRVMLHQPLGGVQGPASDIEITATQILTIKKELYQVIAKHSGQDYQKVHDVCDRDYWLTASEAKDFGIIDEILG